MPDIPCKVWQGSLDSSGYGRKTYKGKNYKIHRLTWELAYGEIPEGLKVCHSCDTPPCYEISHLFLGSHAENMQDMISKGRAGFQKKTHCVHGHEYTDATVIINKNGSRSCRICRAKNAADWQRRNKEALQEYNQSYYSNHRNEILQRKKELRSVSGVGE